MSSPGAVARITSTPFFMEQLNVGPGRQSTEITCSPWKKTRGAKTISGIRIKAIPAKMSHVRVVSVFIFYVAFLPQSGQNVGLSTASPVSLSVIQKNSWPQPRQVMTTSSWPSAGFSSVLVKLVSSNRWPTTSISFRKTLCRSGNLFCRLLHRDCKTS